MIEELKKEMNKTLTENAAVAYKTTNSALLDFFAQGGAMRKREEIDIYSMFDAAFKEDNLLALKMLFYFRDIRKGQGERRTFKAILHELAKNNSDVIIKNINLIKEYGRWDDYFALIDTPIENRMFEILKNQIDEDIKSETPSLLGKWLKSENTSSKESVLIAKKTIKAFNISSKEYRNILTNLRQKIKIVETKLTKKEYNSINYEQVPSKAMLKYKKAFAKHDNKRYTEYLESVTKGDKKINASTLYPYDVVRKILNGDNDTTLNVLWDNLPNYTNDDMNSLVVVDTSGSMYGDPLSISISLGIYLGERCKGVFKDYFITFSEHPELQKIQGNSIITKVHNLTNAYWDMNTNIEAVFDVILKTAINNKIPNTDMVKKIIIISDMEFDRASSRNVDNTLFEEIEKKYLAEDFKMPELVFWNVDARNKQFPAFKNGVQLISGSSPVIFKSIISGKSAYELMLDVLNDERYSMIKI